MALRYWVGGTANWDATAGTKWALTSGGSGGEAVPTSSDDVFFDAASGAASVAISAGSRTCNNLDFTGFTGSFNPAASITISGSLTLGSGMTWGAGTGVITLNSTGAATITSNGISTVTSFTFNGTGSWTLQDNFSCVNTSSNYGNSAGKITLTQGTFNANGHNVACNNFSSGGSSTRTLTLGSGIWTLTSNAGSITWWSISGTGFSYSNTNSTVAFQLAKSGTVNIPVDGTTFRFNNMTIRSVLTTGTFEFGAGNVMWVDGNLTIEPQTFLASQSAGKFVTDHLVMKGSASAGYITVGDANLNAVTFQSDTALFDCDYVILQGSYVQNSSATPITAYAGTHSIDLGSNFGWVFDDATHPVDNSNTTSQVLIPQLTIIDP